MRPLRDPRSPGRPPPLTVDPLLPELAEHMHLDPACASTVLAWTPQHRAVLRVGPVVVKLCPTAAEATASRDHLEIVSALLPSAELVHAEVAAGAVGQTALEGEPLTRDEALTRLQPASHGGFTRLPGRGSSTGRSRG